MTTFERKHLLESAGPEVEEQLRRSPRILVSLGATEQHRPHAPLGPTRSSPRRSVRGWRSASMLSLRRPCPMAFPAITAASPASGLLSVSTLSGVIRDLAVSFTEGGFKHVVFVNGRYTEARHRPPCGSVRGSRRPSRRRDRLRVQLLGIRCRLTRARRISGSERDSTPTSASVGCHGGRFVADRSGLGGR